MMCALLRRATITGALVASVLTPWYSARALVEREESPDPRLVLMVSEYQAYWQRAWRESKEYRRMRRSDDEVSTRHRYMYCYDELYRDRSSENSIGKAYGLPESQYVLVAGRRPSRSWCPTWPLTTKNLDVDDESDWRDGAIRPSLRAPVARKRGALLAALDSAFASDTSSGWLAGQLVRFRVDDRDFAGALRAAARCGAPAWWCAGLSAYAKARNGDMLAADSAFARMREAMPDSLRCAWEDASLLLRGEPLSAYRKLDCAARRATNTRLWWLADPLFRDPGNARLVEQERRRMDIVLRQAVTQDERFSFDDERGGDAVAAVIARYGWPSYRAWSGVAMDRHNSLQHLQVAHAAPPSPPYTSLEYALGQISTIPNWEAITSPFASVASDWQLGLTDSTGAPATAWWPQEHYRPARRIVPLPEGQVVAVRRQSHVEVVAAIELSHPAQVRRDAAFDVLLLSTSAPGKIDSIDHGTARSGATVRLRGQASSDSSILAIEAVGLPPAELDARMRFGFAPPRPLSAMAARDIAVSDIAILTPRSPRELEAPTDSLLRFLYPRRSLSSRERRVTLYWESYGTQPRDSASIVLRVARDNDVGLWQRVGVAVGLSDDPARGIEVRWRDESAGSGVTTLAGPVPAQMRALSLDLSALGPGRYAIDVRMQLRDGRVTSNRTMVVLVP